MAQFKIVIGTKTGKCYQREVKEPESNVFIAKKIGDKILGDSFGLKGYEFEITGGSDNAGFPMRWDVPGAIRKRILAVEGVGIRRKRHGQKQRKTVFGNTISSKIIQINLKVLKEGKEKLDKDKKDAKDAPKKEEKKPVEKKEEPKKEEKKVEP